jgi:hypothetical protein
MKKKHLNIVLLEDIEFKEVVIKIEKALGTSLPYENKKGRYIAEGIMENYKILVVDRVDDIGDFLSDDYYILKIVVDFDDSISQKEVEDSIIKIENNIINRLLNEKIVWKSGIWSKTDKNEEYRRIYPI